MERIEKLNSFILRDPNDLFSRHALAMEWLRIGDERQALKEMETLLNIDESYIGTYYHLAKLLEKLKHFEKARQTYEKGIHLAKKLNDQHSLRELKAALTLLEDEMNDKQ